MRRPSPHFSRPRAFAAGPSGRSGFTLVEILLAISLSTLVIIGGAVFVFSAFGLLTQTQNDPGLNHHKLGVVAMVNYFFSQATTPPTNTTTGGGLLGGGNIGLPSATAGNTTGGNTTGGNTSGGNTTGNSTIGGATLGGRPANAQNKTKNIIWGWPPTVDAATDPYLTFRVDDDNPLLVWENGPRPPSTAWLYFKPGEGLSIIWQTDTQKQLDPTALQRTVLSSLVTKMAYHYYDSLSNTWSETDTPLKDPTTGTYNLPEYIELTFNMEGKSETMSISIPPSQTTVPIY